MSKAKNYFKTICKVSKTFGTTYNKEKLLDVIVDSAIDIMDGKAVCLFLDDERKNVFVPVTQKGLSDNYLHAEPTQAKIGVEAILKGGHIAIYDAVSDPRVENHEAKKAEGIASILVVPVRVREKAIGILSLYTSDPRNFKEDEIDFLGALAEQAGMAISNSRLLERINRNSGLFYNLASSINSSLNIKEIFHILSVEIGKNFGMKGVVARLYNPRADNMDLVASHGLSEEFLNKGPLRLEDNRLVSEIMKGKTVVIKDVLKDDRVVYKKEIQKEGLVSVLCVPIKSKSRVIGDIRLFSSFKRDFSEDLINLINALANQAGIAIENARLVERMRMNTEFFHDLAANVNSTLDVKKILHIMSADIAEILGVKGITIRLVDEESGTLKLVATFGLSQKYLDKGPFYYDKTTMDALKKRPVVTRDVATDKNVQFRKEKMEEGIVSILAVPIHARDDVIGVLKLYSDVPREFTEDDIMLVTAMAHQGGLAIQNASMYIRLQEDKKSLEEDVWSHRMWF
jgi:GAF domain-containing protein